MVGYLLGNVTVCDSYNMGNISATSEKSFAYAGGVHGHVSDAGVSAAANCYSAKKISATAQDGKAFAGGIIGGMVAAEVMLTNCYFLEDTVYSNGTRTDLLVGRGKATVDGHPDGTPREGTQGSGMKSAAEMISSLNDARKGVSIYYTGDTDINSEHIDGWDFGSIWSIIEGVNEGFPVLTAISGEGTDDEPENTPIVNEGSFFGSLVMLTAMSLLLFFIFIGWLRRKKEDEEDV
jgi:hypothetical protein